MKSEPEGYSIDDLKRDNIEPWTGVRNYQVRNMLRDDFKKGDCALFYHSNTGKETGVVGEMKVVKTAYPDLTQFDKNSKYFDPKATLENPRWFCVDVKFVKKFPTVITLAEMKLDPALANFPVLKQGSRLSVMPIAEKDYRHIISLS
jgi:predicted RNA-binding protein with PUA-like domain